MIVQTQTASFLAELYGGIHDLDTDVLKMALYSDAATLNAATTAYSTTNEVTGSGYSAGGATITGVVITAGATGAYIDFTDVVFTAAVTARGALIYNSSKANRSVAVLDFGANKTSTTTLTVTLPAAALDSALIRTTLGI